MPIASRRRAARYIVGSHSVSTRSTLRPRSASSTVATAPSSSAHERDLDVAGSGRGGPSRAARRRGWSPTPMTLAPRLGQPAGEERHLAGVARARSSARPSTVTPARSDGGDQLLERRLDDGRVAVADDHVAVALVARRRRLRPACGQTGLDDQRPAVAALDAGRGRGRRRIAAVALRAQVGGADGVPALGRIELVVRPSAGPTPRTGRRRGRTTSAS